jgi:hypothetical protein
MPLPLNNLLALPYSDEGRSRRSQAKADQLRKGAWLPRSFTLSTLNRFPFLPSSFFLETRSPPGLLAPTLVTLPSMPRVPRAPFLLPAR